MSKRKAISIIWFIPWAVAITMIYGAVFIVIQQSIRLGANDPLVQLASDISSNLAQQKVSPNQFPTQKINISKNLSTFVLVYDSKKKLIATTASIDGKIPDLPLGVLDQAKKQGPTRITWQPKKGVRNAIITVYFKDKIEGYVVVGRNLKEIEAREDMLQTQVGFAWLITLIAVFLAGLISKRTSE